MSTSASKRTLSDREDEDSGPETLLVVRDPYSSDDEKVHEQNQVPEKYWRNKTVEEEHGCSTDNVTYEHVIESFHIKFKPVAASPTIQELGDHVDVNNILKSLLSFISVQVTPEEAVESVLNQKNTFLLKCLYKYKCYQLPESVEDLEYDKDFYLWVKSDLDDMYNRMVEMDRRLNNACHEQEDIDHNSWKSFYKDFFSFTKEGVMFPTDQTCSTLNIYSLQGSSIGQSQGYIKREVVGRPDLVIGRDHVTPGIPVKVEGSHKFSQENSEDKSKDLIDNMSKALSDKMSNGHSVNVSKECNVDMSKRKTCPCQDSTIIKALNEWIPHFTGDQSCLETRLKDKIIPELLIQLLGCSHMYLKDKLMPKANLTEKRLCLKNQVFISLFAYRFHVYVIKLEGANADIYMSGFDGDWHRHNAGRYPLRVSFYPEPLDVRKPACGIALLFFVKYYRQILQH